ncbi:hypothetical protein VCRLGP8_1640115 [Vibrio crassostreae]|nr:hypothetical protein VCRA2113O362_140006 [Vibrio crassostreae]CAK1777092.1 hypothetical protein VCRA2113O363_150006 [Vibrio crassostreae]CAK1931932.1 hypothetical protein VCRA2117O378_260006 [Vibrio crassostreae]CAK1953502.1 hypothetical protein VCRA2113O356_270065 [Vibrio crassostreae]CAK2636549.1 hypothetical protein VCRA2134O405_140114 [Vibrio crassostreae]
MYFFIMTPFYWTGESVTGVLKAFHFNGQLSVSISGFQVFIISGLMKGTFQSKT